LAEIVQKRLALPDDWSGTPRLHEVVILGMKTWLPEETLKGLREAEAWRRVEVRLRWRILEHFREEQRRQLERHFTL
jgi:hypothetical protein